MYEFCPVCGYPEEFNPATYDICPSCGTEVGFDDIDHTHAQLRKRWIEHGCKWWAGSSMPPPPGWSPIRQLSRL